MKNKTNYIAKRDINLNTPSGLMTIIAGETIYYDRTHRDGLVSSHFYGYGQPNLYKWEDVEKVI